MESQPNDTGGNMAELAQMTHIYMGNEQVVPDADFPPENLNNVTDSESRRYPKQ